MKIKKIEIHDFRGLSDVVINKLDDNLNLLLGVNGAGKSSILDAIVLLLKSYTARLTTSAGKGMSISPNDVKKRSRRGCKLVMELDNGVNWTRYKSKGLEKKDEGDLARLYKYTKPLRDALDNDENITLPVVVHYGVNRAVSGMIIPPRSTSYSFEDEGKPNDTYKDWWNRGSIYRDFLLWFKEQEAEENRKRIELPDYRDRGLEAIRDAMRIVFPDYGELKMVSKFQLGLKKNGVEYLLEQLSDGEKCYIALVCDIVRRLTIANPTGNILNGDGIVLIDEIDLHLHPSWESSVMEKLQQTFQNLQFIVSAHSPLVASHFKGDIYAVDNGKITKLPQLYGLNYSTILQDWMMADSENKEMSILANMYKTYKEYNMPQQAEEVWNKIVEATGGDISSPYFENLFEKK